jgi:hypothetical protein
MKLKALFAALLILGCGWQQLSAQRTDARPTNIKQIERKVLRAEIGLDIRKRLAAPSLSLSLFLSKNTDGKSGFYLKQVNGPVISSNNITFAFYPASTIKVMEHLHVMRAVQSGNLILKNRVNIWGNSCADDHTGEAPESKEPWSTALRLMMKESNNQRTNAIQDGMGRPAINNMVHQAAGMSQSSSLNHKFGCGGPTSNPANTLTLADIGLLYEGVAKGTLLSGTSRQTFYELMLNETDAFFIDSIINEEASKLGLPDALKNNFKSRVKIATKAGGIPADYDGFLYQSTAGYVSPPFLGTCSESGFAQTDPRGFVFGVFINKAKNINDGAIGTVASELFREQVRSALQMWKACPKVMNFNRTS